MRDEPRQVTTFCPRCAKPIVWSVTAVAGGEQLEVSGWACFCPLSDDEWADLGSAAAEALDDWDAGGERRVREHEPP